MRLTTAVARQFAVAGCAAALLACCARAQSGRPGGGGNQFAAASESPKRLATEAIENEVKLIRYDGSYLRYQVHTKDAKGDQVREVVESKDGSVARVMLRDAHAVLPEQDAEERQRLQEMLDSPRAFERHIEKDKSGKKIAVDLIRAMPDAMLFSYVAGQPQREGRPAGAPPELVLDFKPNPDWKPPTMASQALTGVQGRCWIDARTHYLTRLEASIFEGINFGWGLFAHIYPGGTLTLEQEPVGEDRWVVSRFTGRLTVREMMVRTVSENTDLYASEFEQVPGMSYQDAIKLLLNAPLPETKAQLRK
jgi:hypothetical protein